MSSIDWSTVISVVISLLTSLAGLLATHNSLSKKINSVSDKLPPKQ